MSKKRTLKKSIFIVCEGKNTEPNYFSRLKEEAEERSSDYTVEVYIHQTAKTHAKGLVEEAQHYVNDYDEVWAVFDRDGYTKHKEAFEFAEKRGKKVFIAFSSIAFEQWVLLHFERSARQFAKAEEVIEYLKEKKYFEGYSKKAEADIYPQLKKRTLTAIENAAWLRACMAPEMARSHSQIYETNPFCTVDGLVGKLIGYETDVVWGKTGHITELHGLELSITGFLWEGGTLQIALEIANRREKAYLFSLQNDEVYLLHPHHRKKNAPLPLGKELIAPAERKTLALRFALGDGHHRPMMLFNFALKKSRWIVEIEGAAGI